MVYYPRIPAVATLLVLLALGGWLLLARRSAATAGDTQLAVLEKAVEKPTAKPLDWLLYAQRLQSLARYKEAAVGYRRFLVNEPANPQALMQCATCLSTVGDKDEFYGFMRSTLALAPKLTRDFLERPDVQPYLTEERFQTLRREAQAQSMD